MSTGKVLFIGWAFGIAIAGLATLAAGLPTSSACLTLLAVSTLHPAIVAGYGLLLVRRQASEPVTPASPAGIHEVPAAVLVRAQPVTVCAS